MNKDNFELGGIIVFAAVVGTIGYAIGSWRATICDRCDEMKIKMMAQDRYFEDKLGKAYVSGWDDCHKKFSIGKDEDERQKEAYISGYKDCFMEMSNKKHKEAPVE